jgi:hypothetical protein
MELLANCMTKYLSASRYLDEIHKILGVPESDCIPKRHFLIQLTVLSCHAYYDVLLLDGVQPVL